MISFTESWQFIDTQGKTLNFSPIITGLCTTLEAMRYLSNELINVYGFSFFATRRCSQDHLEVNKLFITK
jgi:hypothetical protein